MFVPDEDAEVVLRRKNSLFTMLVALRPQLSTLCMLYPPASLAKYLDRKLEASNRRGQNDGVFRHRYVVTSYFLYRRTDTPTEDAFKLEFGTFSPRDGLDSKVKRRLDALEEWEYLMVETHGDLAKAHVIAARDFAFIAPNPYPADSDARHGFDTMRTFALVSLPS